MVKCVVGPFFWHFSCYYIWKVLRINHYFLMTSYRLCCTFWQYNAIFTAKCIISDIVCSSLWRHFNYWRQMFAGTFSRDAFHIKICLHFLNYITFISKDVLSAGWRYSISFKLRLCWSSASWNLLFRLSYTNRQLTT
jgi:hypothetical protein